MIGFNHAATGALIGKFLPWPIALPLAFVSHFALDSLPHYGIEHVKRDKSKAWKIIYLVDFVLAWGLAVLAIRWGRYDMFICGLVSCSPDFFWVLRVVKTHSFNLSANKSRFTKWHAKIQHYERPWGIYLELPLAAILFYFFIQLPH